MEGVLGSNVRGDGNAVTFFEAIRVCLTKYADFTGQASRSEFWWFTLFVTLVARRCCLSARARPAYS
jgi:hypothetical protein